MSDACFIALSLLCVVNIIITLCMINLFLKQQESVSYIFGRVIELSNLLYDTKTKVDKLALSVDILCMEKESNDKQ